MNLEKHKAGVGAFILLALTLLVAGIIVLGGDKYFSRDSEYVLYFNNSVSGLSVGSSVMLRGVPLGTVSRISLITTASNAGVTTPVYVRINSDSLTLASGARVEDENTEQEVIREMINKGLRAQLSTPSLLTGQARIQLDFHPDTKPRFQSPNPLMEIPTIESPIDSLQRTLRRLPIEQIGANLEHTLAHINDFIMSGRIEKTLEAVQTTFTTLNTLLEGFAKTPALTERILTDAARGMGQAPQAMTDLRQAMNDFSAAAEQIRAAAEAARGMVDPRSTLATQLSSLIHDGAAAARSLRSFADTLDRNPESLIRGRHGAY